MNHLEGKFLPFYLNNLDEPSLQVSLKEINESPESRTKCLEILRGELKSLEDIEPCFEEAFLLRFLRVSKFDTSKALLRILKYYKQQDKLLDSFKGLAIPLQKARSLNYIWASPYRLKDNSMFHIVLGGTVDYSNFTFAERFYLDIIAVNGECDIPANQIAGMTIIFDYKGFNFRAVREHTPGWVLLYSETFMNAFPTRIKAVHIVNAPALFLTVYNAIYPFLSKKTKERLIMHPNKDWTKLHEAIPPEILPEEYGGKQKLSSFINVMKNTEELEDGFHKMFNYGYRNTKTKRQSFKPIYRNHRAFSI